MLDFMIVHPAAERPRVRHRLWLPPAASSRANSQSWVSLEHFPDVACTRHLRIRERGRNICKRTFAISSEQMKRRPLARCKAAVSGNKKHRSYQPMTRRFFPAELPIIRSGPYVIRRCNRTKHATQKSGSSIATRHHQRHLKRGRIA